MCAGSDKSVAHLDGPRIVAEGFARLNQKLDRTAADIREEMRRGFADTQAMIKFSHAELDRRIRALEEGFEELQARVERLESSTH
jgi:predicted component of type VI protein secretion system